MDSYGGIDALRLGEVADPRPGPGEVVLGRAFRRAEPGRRVPRAGDVPGQALAAPHPRARRRGRGLDAHPSVTNVRVGETLGILRGDVGVEAWGTLADKVAVRADRLVPIPPGWSAEEMAGAPLVFLTAWQALTQWSEPPAPPPARSVLLVTGASGGVGVASVLLGKSMDLVVVALSRSADKATRLKALGADFVFDPATRACASASATPSPRRRSTSSSTASVARCLASSSPCSATAAGSASWTKRRRRPGFQYRNAVLPADSNRRGRGVGLYAGGRPRGLEGHCQPARGHRNASRRGQHLPVRRGEAGVRATAAGAHGQGGREDRDCVTGVTHLQSAGGGSGCSAGS